MSPISFLPLQVGHDPPPGDDDLQRDEGHVADQLLRRQRIRNADADLQVGDVTSKNLFRENFRHPCRELVNRFLLTEEVGFVGFLWSNITG